MCWEMRVSCTGKIRLAVLGKSGWSQCLKENGCSSVEIGAVRSGRTKIVVLDTRLD